MAKLGRAWELLSDPERFPELCEDFLVIAPEGGTQEIPLVLNPIQRWLYRTFIMPRYKEGLPVWLIILKCRQTGISTELQALNYRTTLANRAWNSLVIGQDDAQTRTLFRMVRRFDSHLEDEDSDEIFPDFARTRDSEEALEFKRPSAVHKGRLYKKENYTTFGWKEAEVYRNTKTNQEAIFLDSRIEVKSGEKKGVLGRAGTYQFIHASEAAYWPDLVASLGALLACCHERSQTSVFIETTANGMNAFYGMWHNLQVENLEVPSLWQKAFIPWYWDHRYELTLDIERVFQDDYEEALYKRIKEDPTLWSEIDPDLNEDRIWHKIFWRRQIIRDKYLGRIEVFQENFPATESEAFMFTGRSVFSATSLNVMEGDIKDPIWRGQIDLRNKPDEPVDKVPTEIWKEPHDFGRFKVWEHPQKFHKYAVFADVAEGKAIEGVSEDKSKWDFSAAQVVKVTAYPPAMEQVAIWHGNCDPDKFGDILVAIAKLYNNAFLAWEVAGPGYALKKTIVDKHRYRKIFMRPDLDSITKRTTRKPGWKTTRTSKPYMVAAAQRFVRQREIIVRCAATLSEMKVYSDLGEGKYGAAQGHDDRITSLCGLIAVVEPVILMMKRTYEEEVEEARPKEKEDRDKDWFMRDKKDDSEHWNPYLGDEW